MLLCQGATSVLRTFLTAEILEVFSIFQCPYLLPAGLAAQNGCISVQGQAAGEREESEAFSLRYFVA
ncbi:MAG: hypothetical protein C0424_00970 [Sphingobacteriaceae bacterium]|nr:hypothetical protein [Sphingobacteriaceae bacterium]